MLLFASSSNWLQRFLIGQNISIDFFNQLKAKPIGIALDTRFFPRLTWATCLPQALIG